MNSWEHNLKKIPKDSNGRKNSEEPVSTQIAVSFMKDEVFPRLKSATETYFIFDLDTKFFQKSSVEISPDHLRIYLSVRFNNNDYSLEFKRKSGFEIEVNFDGWNGNRKFGSFYLDREPESPTIFIESYLSEFQKSFE